MPTFSGGFGPVSAAIVSGAEKRLGVKLPADYRKFLRTINGGSPLPNCFIVPSCGPALADFLYGVGSERIPGDLEFEQQQAAQWEPLPPGLVVIGHDPGGNSLLLATLKKEFGRVFIWDRAGLWARKDGHNTFPVTDSFTEFLKSLREMPEDG